MAIPHQQRNLFFFPGNWRGWDHIFWSGSPSGTNDSYIYALNPDGEFLWKFYTGLVVVYAPSIGSDGTIYAGTTAKGGSREAGQGGIFFALNSNGEERWRYDTSADQMEFYEDNLAQADIYNSPAIASEGRYFYAFDPDGNPVQKYDMYALVPDCQFTTFNSPAISSNGTIYIGDYYYRFNSETGTTEGAIYALQSPSAGLADSPWPKFHNNNKNTGRNN